MASSELSVMLTAKGNLETELRGARDRVKDLSTEIRKIQASGGTVGEDLADEFRQATIAADKLSNKLNEVNRKVRDTARESTTAASKVSKAWMKAADVFNNNLVAGLSAGALVLFGKKAVDTFAQVQDASSALSATFGANGDALIKWAKASGDALNLSQQEALAASQTFAGFASAAGLTGTQLETFATDLTARAADLASYYGGTTADAVQALGSALRGEAEPARRYMIMLDDMALKAELFDLTGQKVTGTLTAQQKILAAQSLIMKKSSQAQGDIARTADSMANQIKDSQQQMADFQATAGETISIALNPLLKIVNRLARGFASLPDTTKQIAIAIGMVSAAALIATPRIVALNGALAARGGLIGVAASGKKYGAGLTAVAVGLIAVQTAASRTDSGSVWAPWRDSVDDVDAVARALGNLKRGGFVEFQMLEKVADGIGLVESRSSAAQFMVSSFDEKLTILVSEGKQRDAKDLFESLVRGSERWGGSVEDVKGALPGYVAAMDAAANAADGTADSLGDLGDASEDATAKLHPLTRAMNGFNRAIDRRNALKQWKQSLKEFVEKPSADAAITAAQAFQATVATFKTGGKGQATFVAENYEEMKRTIEKSELSKAAKSSLLGPLEDAKAEADKVLATLRLIDSQPVNVTYSANGLPSYAQPPIRRAAGGAVWGPGTATSDSIPAMLSNGEYVLRASAVRTIGLGTLNKLNHADKMTDPALLDRIAVGNTSSAPAGGPLIGSIVVNNPSRDVDVEKAVLRSMARAERIRKERG